jgi:hypothetical protein
MAHSLTTVQLSLLTAVVDGHADEVREVVGSLPLRERSPFASVAGTHNGRFVVVSPRPLAPAVFLMCSATIDVPVRGWIERFLAALGPTADAIWSHCPGWPGPAGPTVDYLCSHQVHPALEFATWDVPAATIVEALATRRRVQDLAVRAQGLDASSLLAAYRKEFAG